MIYNNFNILSRIFLFLFSYPQIKRHVGRPLNAEQYTRSTFPSNYKFKMGGRYGRGSLDIDLSTQNK